MKSLVYLHNHLQIRRVFSLLALLCLTSCFFGKKKNIAPVAQQTNAAQAPVAGPLGTLNPQPAIPPSGPATSPTSTPPTSSYTQPPRGDAVGSSSNLCDAPGVSSASQYFDYYKIPIVGHGNLQGGIMWSSSQLDTLGPEWSTNILKTDRRLHIRILVKPNPRACPLPSNFTGQNFDERYSKLKLSVSIRSSAQPTGDYFEKINFTDIKVNECSSARAFANVPVTDDPIIIEVRDVQYDYYCNLYKEGRILGNQYCPYTWVNVKACWEIQLQVATDDTKDIPYTAQP